MKLSKVKIKNFRCFKEEQVIDFGDLTALIGSNSTGKTTILSALLKLFSDNGNDRNFARSDFHLPKDMKADDMDKQELYIETVFEFPELMDETSGEMQYSIPIFFSHFVVNNPGEAPYLRVRLEASWQRGSSIEGSIESKIYYITSPEGQEITGENRHAASRHELDKIRMIYVPAVRDPSKQLKNVSGTMLHRIINGINWTATTKSGIEQKVNELNNVFDGESGVSILKNSLNAQWKEYDSDFRYNNAEMRFNSADMESILKRSEVVFSPTVTGREYGVDEIGDGLKSLFYISLVDTILDVENQIRDERKEGRGAQSFIIEPPILSIIAVEEPENHIAPHLVGKLVLKFNDIAQKSNAQTIIATHSPAIVKRVEPKQIRYLKLCPSNLATNVLKINFPKEEGVEDRYKYIKEAVQAYPEIYFAKLVVLGEGDSEEIVLPRLIEYTAGNIDSAGISVVPLSGRFVNHLWRLLNDLKIPYITLLDLDRERYGAGWGRIKYALEQLISIGVSKEELLRTRDGIVDVNQVNKWDINWVDCMNSWLKHLEKYDVFFSVPLDLDFMMIEAFEAEYKSIIEGNQGPYITGKGKITEIENTGNKSKEYYERVQHDIRCILKENGGNGCTYTQKQKELMIWYNYFFLNRGKPTTHFYTLSKMSKQDFVDNAPDVLKRVVGRISNKINQGTSEQGDGNE